LGDGGGGTPALLCVLVSRISRPPLSPRDLQKHYGLTTREITVATLLAQGRSDREIAELLRLSIHTARRHTEHVLMKLDVHSRSAVAAKMRDLEVRTPTRT
jgi:DNA-binding NarL/FixJ family response regulator